MLLAVLLLVTAPPDPASPQDPAAAKEHFAKGNDAYAVGHFEEALAEFTAAYDLYPAPEFIFNIGQCHFNLGHYDDAVFFYEKYLEVRPDADVARAQLAEARRLAAEAKAAAAKKAEAAHLEEKRRLAEAEKARLAEARRLEEQKRVAAEQARRAQEADDERNAWLLWGGVGAGSAVVLAVAGGVAAVLLTPPAKTVLPTGSLGAIDRRGAK